MKLIAPIPLPLIFPLGEHYKILSIDGSYTVITDNPIIPIITGVEDLVIENNFLILGESYD